jgi:acyl dehydratase
MALVDLEEGIRELEAMVGSDLPRYWPWVRTASEDSIRHFALAVGDENPLWCDPEYGARGPYASQLAPPLFLHTVEDTHCVVGLPGYQGLYMEAAWEFHRPVVPGTQIQCRVRLADIGRRETRYGGLMVLQHIEFRYTDADGQVLATARNLSGRVVPPAGQISGGIKYDPKPAREYTASEVRRIEEAQAAYRRRGAEPRYWEDVFKNEELPAMVHGPFTTLDFASYYAAVGSTGPIPNSVDLPRWRGIHGGETYAPSRASGIYRDVTGFPAYPGRGHLDGRLATQMGMPAAFDLGAQRVVTVSRQLTDWLGDHARLSELRVRIRRPIVLGDTVWFSGKITELRREGGRATARFELWGDNQDGERTTQGWAVAELPTRKTSAL